MSLRVQARRVAAVLCVAGALAAGAITAADATTASWQPATVGGGSSGGSVTLRDCFHPPQTPSVNCGPVTQVPTGTSVHIVCQHAGQNIGGDNVWDYVSFPGREGYMSDYYMITGYANWIPGIQVC
jgi:hypothetical protein